MNRTTRSSPLPARTLAALLTAALLAPAAAAYVNGGIHRTNKQDYENKLGEQGWALCVSETPLDETTKEIFFRIKVDPPDNADFQRYVNRMVGRALRYLPEDEVDKIPLADKRAVARIARETIRDAVLGKGAAQKEGQIGSLKYLVGTFSYASWWEVEERGRRLERGRATRSVAFVALKIVE
jgi:hypothetical protein